MSEEAICDARASNSCAGFSEAAFAELQAIAAQYVASDTIFMRLMARAGKLAQKGIDLVAEEYREKIGEIAEAALKAAYSGARATHGRAEGGNWLDRTLHSARGERVHKVGTAVAGGVEGLFGILGTLADLPVTTTLILRSIQQIAEEHGHDTKDPRVRADCLAVFGMGGPMPEDDRVDSGLWAVRVAIAEMVTPAALAQMLSGQAFALIARRFGVVVSQKAVAQAAPVLGAVAGAAINPVFTDYYQTMAHVHFRLRTLERDHDQDQVRACFERVVRALRPPTDG